MKILDVVRSVVEVGALWHCELLHCMCDLKAMQINVRRRLKEFKLDRNFPEGTKNICTAKGESRVGVQKLYCSKNVFQVTLDDQVKSGWPKTKDSEAKGTIPTSNSWRVSGELDISRSTIACHVHYVDQTYAAAELSH